MCWSYEASAAFATIEAAIAVFLFIRARHASNAYTRKQWMLLPSLLSICAMEFIEAYLWSHPEELLSVRETEEGSPEIVTRCSTINRRLSIFIWLFILPWQPLWVIAPCRRIGEPSNFLLLKVPEMLAIFFGVSNAVWYLASLYFPADGSALPRRNLSDWAFKSYLHSETCTYIGASGTHLHWTFSIPDTYLTPNAFTYYCLWLSVVFAKPARFASGAFIANLFMFSLLLVYYGLSFEAGSVWCFSVITLFLYFVLQPYLLPCKTESELEDNEFMDPVHVRKPLLRTWSS